MISVKATSPSPNSDGDSSKAAQEVRCAVRFPLALPVVIWTEDGEFAGISRNISASGILFELNRRLEPGTEVTFSLRMPGEVLGSIKDVLVHCNGRVVRCCLSHNQYLAAATIDDYRIGEQ